MLYNCFNFYVNKDSSPSLKQKMARPDQTFLHERESCWIPVTLTVFSLVLAAAIMPFIINLIISTCFATITFLSISILVPPFLRSKGNVWKVLYRRPKLFSLFGYLPFSFFSLFREKTNTWFSTNISQKMEIIKPSFHNWEAQHISSTSNSLPLKIIKSSYHTDREHISSSGSQSIFAPKIV